jgi:hypothetical protein
MGFEVGCLYKVKVSLISFSILKNEFVLCIVSPEKNEYHWETNLLCCNKLISLSYSDPQYTHSMFHFFEKVE